MRKMKFMLSIIIFVAGFLVYFIIQHLIEENKIAAGVNESYIGKTQQLGEFYTASKIKIEDLVQNLTEADRVLVINKEDKGYSFEKNEVVTFAKIVEQLIQVEVTKIDSYSFFDQYLLNAKETKELNFFCA